MSEDRSHEIRLAVLQERLERAEAKLARIRDWAEHASQGYDAGNYNIASTPQESCGLAVLAILGLPYE